MTHPMLNLVLLAEQSKAEGDAAWLAYAPWALGALLLLGGFMLVRAIVARLVSDDFRDPGAPPPKRWTGTPQPSVRPAPRPAPANRPNIRQLGDDPTPPPPPQADGPVHTAVGHGQPTQPPRQGMKVVEEWTGDAALRGDFVDIMGALGKKLDKVIAETRSSAELVADLKKENQRLAEEKKVLMDLLQNEQHRRLLNNLIKATNLCERYIKHIKDNPEAIEALEFVRDECRDRLNDAGLKTFSPKVGDRLADLDGTLMDPPAKTVATEDPSKVDTVAEVLTVGYYYERDGKKMPVAKASAVFYRSSSISNPTPSN